MSGGKSGKRQKSSKTPRPQPAGDTTRQARAPRGVPRWFRKWLPLLASTFLVAANICIFGTAVIYFSNQSEFDLTYIDALPLLLGYCIAIAVVLSGIGFVIPERFRTGYVAVVLAVAILLWIQGSFLKWGYGELDGRGINWERFSWQGWVDLAIWLAGIVGAILLRERLYRQIAFVAILFTILQTGFVVTRAVIAKAPEGSEEELDPKKGNPGDRSVAVELCQISRTRNVFHFIMDAAQTDVFLEIIEEDGFEDELSGFVIYRDNMSVGRRTVLAVPAIFSGAVYDGRVGEAAYFRTAMTNSFHNVLYDKGFIVNLIPHITMERTRFTNYYAKPSVYTAPYLSRLLQTSGYLVDVNLFREVPHFLKKFIYNDESWFLSALVAKPPSHMSFGHKAFLRDYTSKLEIAGNKPAYHFIHVMPPHPPFVTLEDGTYAGEALPNNRENYKIEARYVLRLFIEFVGRLKELGVYDSSVIVLQGDHGSGFAPIFDGKVHYQQAGKVAALLAVKAPGASGPLRVSMAPASVVDIPATVLDMVGIQHDYPGRSLLKLREGDARQRFVVYVTDRSSATPILHPWVVTGSVYDSTSWHEGRTLRMQKKIQPYEWGTRLGFGIAGNGSRYMTSGWSTTSGTVHWNDGKSAEMSFKIKRPDRSVHLEMVFFPHVIPGVWDSQRIRMKINGVRVQEVISRVKQSQKSELTIPSFVFKDGMMVISFEFPDAVSQATLGTGRDTRVQAIGMYMFEATLVDPGSGK